MDALAWVDERDAPVTGPAPVTTVFTFERCRLDPVARVVTRDGHVIALSERLFAPLLCLVENRGAVVSKDALRNAIWGGRAVDENSLNRAISSLRSTLRASGASDRLILTVSGRGYRLGADVTLERAAPQPRPALSLPAPNKRRAFRARRVAGLAAAAGVAALLAAFAGWSLIGTQGESPPKITASVAVLPFDTDKSWNDPSFAPQSVSDELRALLVRVPGIRVAARQSSFHYRDQMVRPAQIGRELNVSKLLEGSVTHIGSRLRVAVELVDASSGYVVWSSIYQRDPQDVGLLEKDIVLHVLPSMGRSSSGLTELLSASMSPVGAAYDEFLSGMASVQAHSLDRLSDAISHFDRAITLDPKFARAYAGRAIARSSLSAGRAASSLDERDRSLSDALRDATEATTLDPGLAEAHVAKGFVLSLMPARLHEAEAEFADAVQRSPGDVYALSKYAYLLTGLGKFEQALAASLKAIALDPLSPSTFYIAARLLAFAGRSSEAEDMVRHAEAITGETPGGNVPAGMIAMYEGNLALAQAACQGPADLAAELCRTWVYIKTGQTALAQAGFAKLQTALGDFGAYQYAELFAVQGNTAQALHWLNVAVKMKDPGLADIIADPLLSALRNEPGYKEIVESLNL